MKNTLTLPTSVWREPPIPEPELLQNLAAEAEPNIDWLWHGYLAPGNVTLLTSQWKTGKTTLLSVLLAKLASGGQLAGQPVRPSRAAVVSEEDRMHWRLRGRQLEFGPRAMLFCRPFQGKPSYDQWQTLVDRLGRLRADDGLDLAVIDTISSVLPSGVENQSDALLQVLRPLEQLTSAGVAVLLLHHPRKGSFLAGQAARGSGALTAYADIVIEMTCYSKSDRSDRRRRFDSWSRHGQTPAQQVIELSVDGRDYTDAPILDDDFARMLEIVRTLILCDRSRLSRAALLDRWPEMTKPASSTLWTHLERAVELGLLTRAGSGHRHDAFRYSIPDTDFPWSVDIADLMADDAA